MVEEAENRRWVDNKADKHGKDAKNGWYRYDVHFEIPIKPPGSEGIKWNRYVGTLIVRVHDDGFVLVHMTGMHQNKQVYIDSIMDGTLNYFSEDTEELNIQVDGDTAVMTGRSGWREYRGNKLDEATLWRKVQD